MKKTLYSKLLIVLFIGLFNLTALNAQLHIEMSTQIGGRTLDAMAFNIVDGDTTHIFGTSSSNDYPVTNGSSNAGFGDLVYTKINNKTGAILYASYIGGNEYDYWGAIKKIGNTFYISGTTQSNNFPVTNGSTYGGAGDIFVMKLNAITGNIDMATYIGGSSADDLSGLNIELISNEIYVLANTYSSNFPVTNGSTSTGDQDIVYFKLNENTGAINYSTYLTTTSSVDFYVDFKVVSGIVHITGQTLDASGMPIVNGTSQTGFSFAVFYMALNASNGNIITSTVLGPGNNYSEVYSLEIYGNNAIICGASYYDIPVINGLSYYPGFNRNAFIYSLNYNTGYINYSTYIPGNADESFTTKLEGGNLHLAGTAYSSNLSVTNGSVYSGNADIFYAKLNPSNGSIITLTYLGGGSGENFHDFKIVDNIVHIIGLTSSSDFPTTVGGSTSAARKTTYTSLNTNNGAIINSMLLSSLDAGSVTQPFNINVINNKIHISGAIDGTSFPVTTSRLFQGDRDHFYTVLNLCADKFNDNTILTPSKQVVCKYGYAEPIIGQEITMPGDSFPIIYRAGVATTQNMITAKYQWQKSTTATGPWNNIPGAIQKNYLPSIGATAEYYRRLAFNSTYCKDTISISMVDTVDVSSFTAPVPDAGGVFNTCPSSAVTVGGSPSVTGGTSPFTYSWIEGNNPTVISTSSNPSFSPSSTTIYTLTVTDANSCKQIDQAVVTTITSNAGPDQSACAGDSVRIQGIAPAGLSGTTFSWSPTTGLGCTNCAQPNTLPSVATTYTLTTTINKTGGGTCATTDNVIVTPIAAPTTSNFAGTDKVICFGSTANLGAAPEAGFTYTWTPGSYLTTNYTSATTYNPGSLTFPPTPDSAVYVVTAAKGNCIFNDAVTVSTIRADAGVDGCGPRTIGGTSDVLNLNDSFSWSILSGGGSFIGANNIANTTVTASPTGNPTTYRLTTKYRGQTCTDDVFVPDCGCGIDIKVESPFGCPNANYGAVKLTAIPLTGAVSDYSYSWSPSTGLSSNNTQTVTLTDNVNRTYTVTITSLIDPTFNCNVTYEVNHPSMTLPMFTAKDTTICPSTTVNIGQASVVGYSYSWNPTSGLSGFNISNPTVAPTETKNYIVTVTDIGTSCFIIDTATLTVQKTVADAGPDWLVCNNGLVTLGGEVSRANHVYSWKPGTANWQAGTDSTFAQPEALVATNTTFYLTSKDTLTGCMAYDTTEVVVNNSPTLLAAPDLTICIGKGDTIGMPALPGVSYNWSPSTGLSCSNCAQPIASPTSTVTYTVTATFPGGCTGNPTDALVVTVNNPSFTMSNINYCPSGGAVALSGPAGMSAYSWSPALQVTSTNTQNTNTKNPPPSIATTYNLTVTDVNGCNVTSPVTIVPTQAAPEAGSNRTICLNETTTLGDASNPPSGGSISYSWSPSTGLSSSSISNPIFTPSTTGSFTYTLSKTDASLPCTSTDVITITVNNFQLPAMSSPTICQTASVQIGTTNVPGVTYLWTPGTGLSDSTISIPIATPASSTVYTLIATGVNGCVDNESVAVNISPVPAPTISIPNITGCVGDADTLRPTITPVATYNYLWTPNNGFISATNVLNPEVLLIDETSRTYTFKATNSSNGCLNTGSAVVSATYCPLPLELIYFKASCEPNGIKISWAVTGDFAANYEIERSLDGIIWESITTIKGLNNNNGSISEYRYIDKFKNTNSFYRIKQINAFNFVEYSNIELSKCNTNALSLGVYPNPNNGLVTINYLSEEGSTILTITDVTGKVVLVNKLISTEGINSNVQDLTNLKSGIYFITLVLENGLKQTKQIIIQH